MAVLLSLPNSCSETFYFRPLHYFGLDSGWLEREKPAFLPCFRDCWYAQFWTRLWPPVCRLWPVDTIWLWGPGQSINTCYFSWLIFFSSFVVSFILAAALLLHGKQRPRNTGTRAKICSFWADYIQTEYYQQDYDADLCNLSACNFYVHCSTHSGGMGFRLSWYTFYVRCADFLSL